MSASLKIGPPAGLAMGNLLSADASPEPGILQVLLGPEAHALPEALPVGPNDVQALAIASYIFGACGQLCQSFRCRHGGTAAKMMFTASTTTTY